MKQLGKERNESRRHFLKARRCGMQLVRPLRRRLDGVSAIHIRDLETSVREPRAIGQRSNYTIVEVIDDLLAQSVLSNRLDDVGIEHRWSHPWLAAPKVVEGDAVARRDQPVISV